MTAAQPPIPARPNRAVRRAETRRTGRGRLAVTAAASAAAAVLELIGAPSASAATSTSATTAAGQGVHAATALPAARDGYWEATDAGTVAAFGGTTALGSVTAALAKPVVGMASTSDGKGYWLVASDGGIFSFGDAHFYGSTGGITLNKPVVGMTPTPGGKGYWLVATDGGLFSFGDAGFYGSGADTLPAGQQVVALAVGPGKGSVSGGFPVAAPVPTTAAGVSYPSWSSGYGIPWPQCGGSYPPASRVAVVSVPSVPAWYPTGVVTSHPVSWCSSSSFAGGPITVVQDVAGSYDADYSC